MWQPDFLHVKNLFTHVDTRFRFKRGVMTMILGVNKTEAGSDSNGSGKSSLPEGITLACTGEVYRKIKKNDFIRTGQKECFVAFGLVNAVLQETMVIERTVFLSKSSFVRIIVNGRLIFDSEKDRTTTKDPNKIIFEKFGFSEEDFLNYYILGQGNENSFFTAGDAKQKEVIARFSNYTQLDELIAGLQADIKVLENRLVAQRNEEYRLDGKIESIGEQKKTITDSFAEDKAAKIADCKASIQDIKNKIAEYEATIKTVRFKYADDKAEVMRLDTLLATLSDVSFKQKIEDIQIMIGGLETEMRKAKKTLGELSTLSGQAMECPKCGEKFIPESDKTPEEITESITAHEEYLVKAKAKIATHNERIDALQQKIDDIAEYKAQRKRAAALVQASTDRIANLSQYVDDCKEMIEKELENLQTIKAKTVDHQLEKLNQTLEGYIQHRSEIQSEIGNVVAEIMTKQYYEFHFGKKGLKTFLANKSIRNIQDLCNFYLKKFDTDMQVLINGYTTLKNGDIRDKIEVNVLQGGSAKGLFAKYSGGEKSRVNVCGIITINRLINNSCEYGKGLDLLVLDETVDYLDERGYTEVIKILGKLDTTCLLIMHQVATIPYPYKLVITKENGVSKITENTCN